MKIVRVYWQWLKEEGFLYLFILMTISFLFDALMLWIPALKNFFHVKSVPLSFVMSFVLNIIYAHVFTYTKWLKTEAKKLLNK
jgi:hypothetical protein